MFYAGNYCCLPPRLFELQSSGRQNVLRLRYRTTHAGPDSMAVVTVPLDSFGVSASRGRDDPFGVSASTLADDRWHRLAVVVSGTQLKVFLDCR